MVYSLTSSTQPLSAKLRPPWVHLARVAWLVVAMASLTLFVAGTVATIRTPLPSCAAANSDCTVNVQLTQEDVQVAAALGFPLPLAPVFLVFSLGARLSLALVGIIIFWRRSDDWVAMIMSAALMSVLLEGVQGIDPSQNLLQELLSAIGTACFLPIPFIFPNGQIKPRWLRWPMILITVAYTGLIVFFLNSPVYWNFSGLMTLLWVIFGGYAMIYRYFRVSNTIERQQTKWVLLGITASFVVGIYYMTTATLYPITQPSEARIIAMIINLPIYLGGYGFLAFSILVAMLRYRLWDIDILIRRTLHYTLLTGLMALVYFGTVVILQNLFVALTGQSSQVVIVISTLSIAALFNPLRRRIQEFIDHRFYRRKYNAEQALAQFAVTARDEVEMEKLAAALLNVIQETIQPERIGLWQVKEKRNVGQ